MSYHQRPTMIPFCAVRAIWVQRVHTLIRTACAYIFMRVYRVAIGLVAKWTLGGIEKLCIYIKNARSWFEGYNIGGIIQYCMYLEN